MTRETTPPSGSPSERPISTYYTLLNLHPSASVQQIRRAYRELSKLYHPDTTNLPAEVATAKFQELNEAYATLSSPERRFTYDLKIGYSRVSVIQPSTDLNRPVSEGRHYRSSAYLDPTDRPLSAGEIFALFILGLTFAVCLVLVVAIGLTRGETGFLRPPQPVETAADLAPAPPLSPPVAPVVTEPLPDCSSSPLLESLDLSSVPAASPAAPLSPPVLP